MKRRGWQASVERRWYGSPGWLRLLTPLESVFHCVSVRRRTKYEGLAQSVPVPLIVVGNIAVGGTGKTPAIIALVKHLQSLGLKPGVISRGYGRDSVSTLEVSSDSNANLVGDEPLLVFRSTSCRVVVSDKRIDAAHHLLASGECDIILSDDGLQHYQMARDAELIMVDGERLFGNGRLLPVGPLRELPERVNEADWCFYNAPDETSETRLKKVFGAQEQAWVVRVMPTGLARVANDERLPLSAMSSTEPVVAMVGLGNPNKFFASLDSLGLNYEPCVFPDHHRYSEQDFSGFRGRTIIMTDKDAVKCRHLVDQNVFALNVEMRLPEDFLTRFSDLILQLQEKKKTL